MPGALPSIGGSLFWAAAMAVSALWSVWSHAWSSGSDKFALTVLFAVGGLIAFLPAATLARMARRKRIEARFAAWFLTLTISTILCTGFAYALHFRFSAAHHHSSVFSLGWAVETGFTIAAAFYQFLVLGIRLYFPIGFAALLVAAIWMAKRSR